MDNDTYTSDTQLTRALLAGVDTIYPSCDFSISAEMRERLTAEKQVAQTKAITERTVHCPGWLGARVCPQVSSATSLGDSGSTGSYAHRTSARAAAHRAGTRADTTPWAGYTDGWEEWLP